MFRRKRTLGILAVVISVPVIGIAWWLLAPLFTSATVEEEFPFASAATVPPDMTRAQVEMVMSGIAKMDSPANEPMPPPPDPATALNSALGGADPEGLVNALAEAAVKSMPGAMTASGVVMTRSPAASPALISTCSAPRQATVTGRTSSRLSGVISQTVSWSRR